jgi:hypothetical protein
MCSLQCDDLSMRQDNFVAEDAVERELALGCTAQLEIPDPRKDICRLPRK